MYVVLSIHQPKPEYEAALIDSMHRFGNAVRGKPGCIRIHTLKDERSNRLVGLAMFESKAAWEALAPLARAAVKDDPFDVWEEVEMDGFALNEA